MADITVYFCTESIDFKGSLTDRFGNVNKVIENGMQVREEILFKTSDFGGIIAMDEGKRKLVSRN